MSLKHLVGVLLLAAMPGVLAVVGCASGSSINDGEGGGSFGGSGANTGSGGDGTTSTGSSKSTSHSSSSTGMSCGNTCDSDGDGIVDGTDQCPDTPKGEKVNPVGCSDTQVTPKLHSDFPPYGLTWTPAGDPGRAGGLTWTYTGITRGSLFHIDWIICDDPTTPCGVSMDGPIDVAAENWTFDAADSSLAAGKVVFVNATHITLADGTSPALVGRLTVTAVDSSNAPLPFVDLKTLGVTGLSGQYGTEVTGTGFTITALIEVQDSTAVWTPYLDYYDAAATPNPPPGATMSFGGSFYDD